MDGPAELVEVREFLAAHAPFDEPPQAELQRLVGEIRIEYFRRGATLIARGADNHHLYVLRSGAADLRDQDGELVERSDAGATFGSITLTQGNPSTFEVVAIEDSLAYLLPAETFYRLVRDHPAVARSSPTSARRGCGLPSTRCRVRPPVMRCCESASPTWCAESRCAPPRPRRSGTRPRSWPRRACPRC
jgi:hypothetical protein